MGGGECRDNVPPGTAQGEIVSLVLFLVGVVIAMFAVIVAVDVWNRG
jgi:hypothetical protein